MSKDKQNLKRIRVLKVIPNKEGKIYLRQIDGDLFEYMILRDNEIYTSYVVVTPRKGKNKLNKDDIQTVSNSIEAAAYATLGLILEREKNNGKSGIVK